MKRTTMWVGLAAATTCVCWVSPAHAVRRPEYLNNTPSFEVARGSAARLVRRVVHDPSLQTRAWKRFQSTAGGRWRSMWDAHTDVPLRVYGSGIPAPGAVSSAAQAAHHSWVLLTRYVDLLAPGASPGDFVLVSNEVHRGVRSVGFYQLHQGLRVLTGQVSFRFKHDRMLALGSEALPRVDAPVGGTVVSQGVAEQAARAWIWDDFGWNVGVLGVEGPAVLPIVRERGGVEYHTVWAVTVHSRTPLARWAVYVDVATAEVVARRQLLRFYTGTVQYNVPVRWPGDTRIDAPAVRADLTVDGNAQTSDASGMVTWSATSMASVHTACTGPRADIINDAGGAASATLSLADGGAATWNDANTEFVDSQLASFVHANEIKVFARALNPFMGWLNGQITVTVNMDQTCNAVSDGDQIYFFRANNQCENTGRISDVLYHEFGHSFHANSIIWGVGDFDESLSEGLADYTSATYTGDPGMGRGFFYSSQPLRHIDPSNTEYVWPDDITGESHQNGLIVSGALWDLRKELIADYGDAEGVAITDRLFYAAMQRASDIPSSYVAVLVEDDDDGDLENGTPNGCAIKRSFGLHGLTGSQSLFGGVIIHPPTAQGTRISIEARDPGDGCDPQDVTAVSLDWEVRGNPGNSGTVDMTLDGSAFYTGDIPPQDVNSVVRYRVTVELSEGLSVTFPDNPADPMYELYVGQLTEIYCTDFETNPWNEGWTHGLTAGQSSAGADDWHWGPSEAGSASGDPVAPFSGDNVIGNDLGGTIDGNQFNGLYQSNKVNYALSPVVDATGFDSVRLQYRRWLNVEDGHFDQGTIYANDSEAWTNLDSNAGDGSNTHHQDREWRFHDVDLTPYLDADGTVQVKFEIASDGGLELGGWTIDDFCILGYREPYCGDGDQNVAGEECDDGQDNSDTEPDACRTDCLPAACGDGVLDTGEECDDGNDSEDDECTNECTFPVRPSAGGCDCATGAGVSGAPLILGLLALWLGFRRRRRR
ncbi:MAG: MYXO-CTERM sorting domain-containing protein [bacterium]